MTISQFISGAGLGLAAGVLGGLAGVGGSMIILPGLHWMKVAGGGGDPTVAVHHLYMAAAMVTNIAVALPAAMQHKAAGAVRKDLLQPLLISSTVGVLVGVTMGNQVAGVWLKWLLGGFLVAYCVYNLIKLSGKAGGDGDSRKRGRVGMLTLVACGGVTGTVGGLLGLGGGVILVPLLQMVCGVKLRESIATSSSIIWITAIIGATYKLVTLSQHGQSAWVALAIAAALAPTAVVGSKIGAWLTHALPVPVVRAVITAVLVVAAMKLFGVF